ncbi:hypothetical protein K491DRAFT_208374 [Lophiostoma macrostomum CBS 122681]|uniref:Uncharacterized protein n=1 Tax=Lophiostoma macrostomum CBS 122681 TaxID=1314788 RepID=A0A6A6SNM2_9PLEO|nr:hypothetical protein K491DRAFT_208374 [Lophiostoma macrostomum CBS 122681]
MVLMGMCCCECGWLWRRSVVLWEWMSLAEGRAESAYIRAALGARLPGSLRKKQRASAGWGKSKSKRQAGQASGQQQASERARAEPETLFAVIREPAWRKRPQSIRARARARRPRSTTTQITHTRRDSLISPVPPPSHFQVISSASPRYDPTTLTQHYTQTLFQPPTSLIMTGRESSHTPTAAAPLAMPGALLPSSSSSLLTRPV